MDKDTIKHNSDNLCEVCGSELVNGVCPECGFVGIIFPREVPSAITNFNKERKNIAKSIADGKTKRLSEISQLQVKNAKLMLERDEAKKGIAKNHQLIEEYKIKISTAEKQAAILQSSNKKLQHEIELMDISLSNKNNALYDANQKISQLHAELAKQQSMDGNKAKGVVMIEDIAHKIRAFLPVYEGDNTYGSDISSSTHHQIKLMIRGVSFAPKHFSVKYDGKDFIFTPNTSNITVNGELLKKSIYARQTTNIYINNKILINISKL